MTTSQMTSNGLRPAPRPEDGDLITTQVAARILGTTVSTVNRLVREDKLEPAHQGPGIRGARFFHEGDIHELRDRRLMEASPCSPR